MLDDSAATLTHIQYKPYGETFVHKGDQDFAPKYNSQELDQESKLYYYNARYYDPQVARFTSPDTVLDGGAYSTQAWNRYMYVRGNPIRYKDPTGHEAAAGCGIECGKSLGQAFSSLFGGNKSEPAQQEIQRKENAEYVAKVVEVRADLGQKVGGALHQTQTNGNLIIRHRKIVVEPTVVLICKYYQDEKIA